MTVVLGGGSPVTEGDIVLCLELTRCICSTWNQSRALCRGPRLALSQPLPAAGPVLLPCDRRETESQRAQPAWHLSQCSSQTCPPKEGHLPQRGVPVVGILGSSEECSAVRRGCHLRQPPKVSWASFSPGAMQRARAHVDGQCADLCRMGWPPLVQLPWLRSPPALHKPLRDKTDAGPLAHAQGRSAPALDEEPWPALCAGAPAGPPSARC